MFDQRRETMVQQHVIDKGVKDPRVISAMRKVERHRFVPPAMRHQAYLPSSLPIGMGQTISHPTTVALMTQLLELTGKEKILEIGTGSGYQAAVLAEIGVKVFSVERIPEIGKKTQRLFDELGYFSIGVRIGDGSVGWSTHAPYDRIIVTAASPSIPPALVEQLGEEGRLIIPVGTLDEQKLTIVTRKDGKIHKSYGDSRTFVPLIGKTGWEQS